MKTSKMMLVLTLSLLLWSCNEKPELGTYKPEGYAHFDKITLKSRSKAELVFMGSTMEVGYDVEDGKVRLTTAGQTQLLTMTKDGCLDGGGIMGKYCLE